MKKLLNTLYVTSEDSYLSLDGENVVIFNQTQEMGRIPLHNLEAIVSFGYRGASPALMGGCAGRNISLCFLTPQGKFLARITGCLLYTSSPFHGSTYRNWRFLINVRNLGLGMFRIGSAEGIV